MPHFTPLRLSYHCRGSSDDKSHRTAGMIARADAPLVRMATPLVPRIVRAARRLVTGGGRR